MDKIYWIGLVEKSFEYFMKEITSLKLEENFNLGKFYIKKGDIEIILTPSSFVFLKADDLVEFKYF